MFVVAAVVDAVAAAHEDDSLRRGEHVIAADGTVTISGALDAAVRIADGDGHADATSLRESLLGAIHLR